MRKVLVMSALAFILSFFFVVYAQRPEGQGTLADVHAAGPVSAVGHGAMFDREGKEIQATPEFIAEAQRYYLTSLLQHANEEQRARLAALQQPFEAPAKWSAQERAYANHALIAWLIEQLKPPKASLLASINGFLRRQYIAQTNPKFVPSRRLLQLLPRIGAAAPAGVGNVKPLDNAPGVLRSTMLSGSAYVAACAAAGVPTPPSWGSSQWTFRGALTTEFISAILDAEVFSFTSNSPAGVCMALPRSQGSFIQLLGIICMSKSTGKACFWDNQNNDEQFPIPKGATVALSQFAGGAELDGGNGGECTQCHTGENPFIVHPGTPSAMGSVQMPNKWYQPMVHPAWLQNPGPTNLLACVPLGAGDDSCLACHSSSTAGGGRFPAVSTALSAYCGTILNKAITTTMPPFQPGSPTFAKHAGALNSACGTPPAAAFIDLDLDCVEDSKDNCKGVSNAGQQDQDGDGFGNECDNCPGTQNKDQLNTDGDQQGDACDLDDDNDLCVDTADDKPTQDSSIVGFRLAVNCPDKTKDVWGWDGEDPDGDGMRNCADTDDDNDDVLDANDKCPVDEPQTGGPPGFECMKSPVSCPLQVPWDVCMFGGCNQFLIKILSVINPNPVIIDKFRIIGTDVYMEATAGQSLEQIETAVLALPQLAGGIEATVASPAPASARNRTRVRMEIWSRDAPGTPGRRVATIAEYDPFLVQLIAREGQPALMVTPVRNGRGLVVTRTIVRAVTPKATVIGQQR